MCYSKGMTSSHVRECFPEGVRFVAYLDQGEGGCDYTIACAKTIHPLAAQTWEEARAEMVEFLTDSHYGDPECGERLRDVVLVEVAHKPEFFDLATFHVQQRARKAARVREEKEIAERREYERLHAKFGEPHGA